MQQIYLILLASLLFCPIVETQAQAQKKVIVFIDKSASVTFSDPALAKKSKNGCISAVSWTSSGGDQLLGYYLHAGAGSSSLFLNDTIRKIKPGMTPLEEAIAKKKMNKIIDEFRRKQYHLLLDEVQSGTSNKVSSQSPILKSLEIASTQFQANTKRKIIYFSDMVECSSIRKMLNPKSKAEAETQAREDAQIIVKKYAINRTALNGSLAEVYLPQAPMGKPLNEYVPYYWTELFRQFNIKTSFF